MTTPPITSPYLNSVWYLLSGVFLLIYWFTVCLFPREHKRLENTRHVCLLTITLIAEGGSPTALNTVMCAGLSDTESREG